MRAALLQLPRARTVNETRQVLRAAIRQLDRSEVYLAAVEAMEIDDRAARRMLRQLSGDMEGLRRHLADLRART